MNVKQIFRKKAQNNSPQKDRRRARGHSAVNYGRQTLKKEGMVNRAKVAKRASEKDWSSFSIILLITGNPLMYLLVCYLFPLPGCL